MTNAVSQAHTLEKVVEIINESKAGRAVEYSGGTDLREAEEMAAQYALAAAEDAEDTSDESIEAHLDFLVDAGARFDFRAALEIAVRQKEKNPR